MGYYTYYDLEIKNVTTEEMFNAITEELNKRDIIGYALELGTYHADTNTGILGGEQCAKWYDNEEDMSAISKMFPECVFILSGAGEEQGDLWKSYFKNGLSETCYADIVYEEPHGDFSY